MQKQSTLGEEVKRPLQGMVFLRRFDSGEYYAKGVPTEPSFGASSQEETSEASPTEQSRLQSLKEHHSRPPIRKHHKGSIRTLPQVVPLADFHPTQEGRVIQTHNRSVRTKQIFDSSKIQDGNSFHHQELPMCSPMGMQGRHKSGIPQCPNLLQSSGVHSIHHREGKETPDLCVPVPSVRSVVGTMGLPQNNKTNQKSPEGLNDLRGFIPGRLRVFRNNKNGNAPSHTGIQGLTEKAQPFHQHVKVGFHSQTLYRVPGSAIRPKEPFAITPGKQDSFRSVREQIPYDSPCMLQEGFRIPNRAFKFRSRVHPARTSPSTSSDQMDEPAHLSPLSRSPRLYRRHSESVPRGLDIETLPLHVHPHAPPPPDYGAHDRCLQGGLVWGSPASQNTRALARLSLQETHQLVRTQSSPFITASLPTYSPRPYSPFVDRQQHSPVVSPKPWLQNPRSHKPNKGDLRALRLPRHFSNSTSSPRSPQRPCRRGFEASRNSIRMDARQDLVREDSQSSEHLSPGRPFCHQGQQTTGELCVSLPRPRRGGQRRISYRLEQVGVDLPVSSSTSSSEMSRQTRLLRRYRSSRNRRNSLLCGRSVHSHGTQTEMQVRPPSPSGGPQSSNAGRRSFRPAFYPSRLDTVNQQYKYRGFSANTLKIFNQRIAPSTTKSYQFVWDLLLSYLSVKGISATNFDDKYLWDFLTHHHEVLKRKYRTLAKYRAALVKPLKNAVGFDLNNCDFSPGYMRGLFRIRPPVVAAPMPSWTLNIICSYLKSSTFEPLREKDLLTVKTKLVLLLFIATGRRASEITNLGRTTFNYSNYPGRFLDWADRKFLNKNFVLVRKFKIKTGCRFPDQPYIEEIEGGDKRLCPVRAYDEYMDRTRGKFGRFLWDHSPSDKPNTPKITNLVISAIASAIRHAGIRAAPKKGPHQFRKLSASYGRLLCKRPKDEDFLKNILGFSSLNIMRKVYIKRVPRLAHACVVPGGTYIPGVSPTVPRNLT